MADLITCEACGDKFPALQRDGNAGKWRCEQCYDDYKQGVIRVPDPRVNCSRLNAKGRLWAALDDEQVERIAVRVVALLAEKLGNAWRPVHQDRGAAERAGD